MPRDNPPSPDEIAERCRMIQAEWSESERWSRMRADWRPTFIRADGQRIAFDHDTYSEHIAGQTPLESEPDDFDLPQD